MRNGLTLVFAGAFALLPACGGNGGGPGAGGAGASSASGGGEPASGSGGSGSSGTNSASGGHAGGASTSAGGGSPSGVWSLGYYASWQPDQYPVSAIEWSGLTHIAIAFYTPNSDGSLSLLGADPDVVTNIVTAAHAHGVKVIASIGGADSGTDFEQATMGGTGPLVQSLASLLSANHFDGVDIDWEPLNPNDEPVAIDIANKVRSAKSAVTMTIAIGYVNPNDSGDLSGYPAIAAAFDQLNIMSYGMAGAWPGWKSWHDSPLYQMDPSTPLSIDSSVAAYVTAGVAKAKLGVGIGFFGLCYSAPVTGPVQALGGSMIVASDGTMSYANIMGKYYSAGARTWDSDARVPYLSFDSAHGPDGCTYISYDDDQSIEEKGKYVKTNGLGGVMEWEINEAYLPSAPANQGSPLLLAIHDHVLQ